MNNFLTAFADEVTKLGMMGMYPANHTGGMMAGMGAGMGTGKGLRKRKKPLQKKANLGKLIRKSGGRGGGLLGKKTGKLTGRTMTKAERRLIEKLQREAAGKRSMAKLGEYNDEYYQNLRGRQKQVRQEKLRDELVNRRALVRSERRIADAPPTIPAAGPGKPDMTLANMRRARSGTPSGPSRTGPAVTKIQNMPPMVVNVGDVRKRVLGSGRSGPVARQTNFKPRPQRPIQIRR